MRYLTYSEYLNIGGECDSIVFSRNIDRACAIIDNVTYKRLENMRDVPYNVKVLCCELVDYYATQQLHVSSQSQSAGGVSESKSYVVKTTADVRDDIYMLVRDYLGSITDDDGIPLLYVGCGC